MDTEDITEAIAMFNWIEYTVFGTMLGLSALVGLYFGCFKKQNTVSEYMLGGKKMGVFPVTMSLIASHVSGIMLLGIPAEVYTYGTQYSASIYAILVTAIVSSGVCIPVFYKLQLQSPFEYLELRFSYICRVWSSFLYALCLIFIIPIIMYVPALAFNQVTGVPVHVITPIVGLICISYTAMGGLKAVIWTDTLQSFFTSASLLVVIYIGYTSYGGVSEILRINEEGHRLEWFNMDPNIFERSTFWTIFLGFAFQWMAGINFSPGVLQRQISVSSYRKSQLVTIYSMIGFIITKILCCFVGLLMYAKFHDCDPVATAVIKKSGQLVPYYVIISAKEYPGLTGLFISGVVSSALSTMSAGLNTAAGTIYEDFAQIFLKGKKQSDAKASFIMKMIVTILGIVCIFLVYVVDKFDSILQIVVSVTGFASGASVSIFILGLFFPWANTVGAMVGSIVSFGTIGWISVGAQLSITQGKLQFPGKVTSIDNCPYNITMLNATSRVQTYTGIGSPVVATEDILQIYKVSYAIYCMIGVFIGTTVGIIVSFITKNQDLKDLNPDLVVPFMRKFLPMKAKETPEENILLKHNTKLDMSPKDNIAKQ